MNPHPPPQPLPIIHHPQTIHTLPQESFPPPSPNNLTWRTLLSTPSTPSSDMCAGLASCPPYTGHLALHRHKQAEIYHITAGSGDVIIEGTEHAVSTGTAVFIPGDAEHGVRNRCAEVLEWFYVFPTPRFGDVVYRFGGEGGGL